MAAAVLSGASVRLSVAEPLTPSLRGALAAAGVEVVVEAPVVWQARLADLAASGELGVRVRLLGPRDQDPQERWEEASRVTGGSPDVALYTGEATACPHSELLPFLHEQAVSVTSHRFGTPFDLAEGLL